jgi:hypothetical protein
MSFFDKGSLLKHKNLQLTARILSAKEGKFTLAWVKTSTEDFFADHSVRGEWTTVQLIQEFVPLIQESRWDRLLDGHTPLGDDAFNPRGESEPQQEV